MIEIIEFMSIEWRFYFCILYFLIIVLKLLKNEIWKRMIDLIDVKYLFSNDTLSFSFLTLLSLSIPSTLFIIIAVNGTKMPSKNFVFKCHRDGSNVHSVNSIDFHHYGSFCTAGSDGTFSWWDKEARYVRAYILLFYARF